MTSSGNEDVNACHKSIKHGRFHFVVLNDKKYVIFIVFRHAHIYCNCTTVTEKVYQNAPRSKIDPNKAHE